MWSVPYFEAPTATTSSSQAIPQCCAWVHSPPSPPSTADSWSCSFQRLGNIPQGDPHAKAPHYRFLCWVILHRTLDLSIEKRERLRCPLSSCKATFGDQQYLELVSHVSSCPYLARGLYRCPYHGKEESFCWEMPFAFATTSDEAGCTSGSLPNLNPYRNAPSLSPRRPSIAHPAQTHTDESQLFNSTFAEFDREAFPEVFISEQGNRKSPSPGQAEPRNKRKYSEFLEPLEMSTYAEFDTGPLPQTTRPFDNSANLQAQFAMNDMAFELPSTNAHLSSRQSPEISMQTGSPQIVQEALQMNLDPFGLSVPSMSTGRGVSPPLVSPGFGDSSTSSLARTTHSNVTRSLSAGQIAGPGPSLPQQTVMSKSASPKGKGRASSNASTVVPSQPSPQLHSLRRTQSHGTEYVDVVESTSETHSRNPSDASEISPVTPGGGTGAGPNSSSDNNNNNTAESEKGSVTCKECGKVLSGKVAWLPSNLQRHMREIHLSAPKTECRICHRTFNRGHNLRHHMKAVHGEQP